MQALAELAHVTKEFPGVRALDRVCLTIYPGEIHGLVGENGAGKSTLMKIFSGIYPAGTFTGQLQVKGRNIQLRSPEDAQHHGLAIIHQELSTFPHLTVAENIAVGHWPLKKQHVDWSEVQRFADFWLNEVSASFSSECLMGDLSVGQQQMVEIAKALSRRSDILVLDEPTSSLPPHECQVLFALLKKLRAQGKGLVFISHKFDEIFSLCDRLTVLRDGQTVTTGRIAEFNEKNLIEAMVGRSLERLFPLRKGNKQEAPLLEVQNLGAKVGSLHIGPLSFQLRRGEILGFGGLLGSGRSELMKVLYSGTGRVRGQMCVNGKPLPPVLTPKDGLANGISFVSEDRKSESLLPRRSLRENLLVTTHALKSLWAKASPVEEMRICSEKLKVLQTKCTGPEQEIQNLSGGNQQKVFIARALATEPDILIFDEPTRGIDVGAKSEIYEIIFKLADQGKGILLISSELPELMALSDRIIMMNSGQIQGELPKAEFSQEKLMTLAIGTRGH